MKEFTRICVELSSVGETIREVNKSLATEEVSAAIDRLNNSVQSAQIDLAKTLNQLSRIADELADYIEKAANDGEGN